MSLRSQVQRLERLARPLEGEGIQVMEGYTEESRMFPTACYLPSPEAPFPAFPLLL